MIFLGRKELFLGPLRPPRASWRVPGGDRFLDVGMLAPAQKNSAHDDTRDDSKANVKVQNFRIPPSSAHLNTPAPLLSLDFCWSTQIAGTFRRSSASETAVGNMFASTARGCAGSCAGISRGVESAPMLRTKQVQGGRTPYRGGYGQPASPRRGLHPSQATGSGTKSRLQTTPWGKSNTMTVSVEGIPQAQDTSTW